MESGPSEPAARDVKAGFADRAGRIIASVTERVTVVMFAIVFIAFITKIVMRYGAGDAAAWADELAIVMFIWIVFLANGFVVEDRRQIAFDLIHRNVSARNQRAIEIVRLVLIGGIFAASLPAVIDYTLFLWRERTPVLRWRLDIIYACFALFMIALLVRMLWRLTILLGVLRSSVPPQSGGSP